MTFEQLNEGNAMRWDMEHLQTLHKRCEAAIKEEKCLFVMGEEIPLDVSKNLLEKAKELLEIKLRETAEAFKKL